MGESSGGELIDRRELLRRCLLGAAGVAILPAVAAACGQGTSSLASQAAPSSVPSSTARPTPTPTLPATPVPSPTLGGALSFDVRDANPGYADGARAVTTAFRDTYPGIEVTLDLAEPAGAGTLPGFLQTDPDDLLAWRLGIRTRSFARAGLLSPVDDVWTQVKGNYAAAFERAVTADDAHVYGIPTDFSAWVVYYRKSVWAKHGYVVPDTWDRLLALCAQMRKDGLTPIAFGDRDGWPAMSFFDYLDLRRNGTDFHLNLLAGRERWTDARVTDVFDTWRAIVPFYSTRFAGRTWQQAADDIAHGTAGMYLTGSFVTGEFDFLDPTGAVTADLDFFPFPYFGNSYDAERAVEAPIDIIALCARSKTLAQDRANAAAYLAFWARPSTQLLLYKQAPGYIPAAADADTAGLSALDRKAVELVSGANRITSFFDRDTRPDFAGANGMQAFLLRFLQSPAADLSPLQKSIQDFYDGLPAADI